MFSKLRSVGISSIIFCLVQSIKLMLSGKKSYASFFFLKQFLKKDKFCKYRNRCYSKRISHIKKHGDIIRVGFLSISDTNWCADGLYQLFEKDERFEPIVIIVPFFNGTTESINNMYQRSIDFFREKGYRYIETAPDNINSVTPWEKCGEPQLLFYLNPHTMAFPPQWRITSLPQSVITAYIPYGFMVFGGVNTQYNQTSHHLFWKIFAESEISKDLSEKYCRFGSDNVVVSGYPKMDKFYASLPSIDKTIWKSPVDVNKVAKLIYSPHHSLKMKEEQKGEVCQFSTFDENYRYVLEYARTHVDTTSWVYRPHPLIEKGVVLSGLFSSISEYHQYVQEWESLPNAVVALGGTYDEIFLSCDALINDSVSFMSECLYAHKPMLFFTSDGDTFNDYGSLLKEIHYSCKGNDEVEFNRFIEEIVISKKDYRYRERESFFERYLDYYKKNGLYASEFIYQYIVKEFT